MRDSAETNDNNIKTDCDGKVLDVPGGGPPTVAVNFQASGKATLRQRTTKQIFETKIAFT